MQRSPPPFIWASPEEKNILDCELMCVPAVCAWPEADTTQGTSSL